MRVLSFTDVEGEFRVRVARDLCCNLTTIDAHNRPRSRVVHPLWEGVVGWVLTDRTTPKVAHIAAHPFVSLAYVGDPDRPAYAECRAQWVDDIAEIERVWNLFRDSPLGYDPARYYESPGHPDVGLLRLTPWRIQIDDSTGDTIIWESTGTR